MAALLLSEKKEQKEMESMRDVNRVMEHEIKKGSTPLQFEQLNFGDYSYNEISSQEKLVQVLSYLLRIGEYKPFAGKTIGNNIYMDIKWKKVVFKRTRLAYERNNIFVTIKRLAKKYKPDFAGKGAGRKTGSSSERRRSLPVWPWRRRAGTPKRARHFLSGSARHHLRHCGARLRRHPGDPSGLLLFPPHHHRPSAGRETFEHQL